MKKKTKTSILTAASLTGVALSLSGQTVIYSTDFDTTNGYSQNDSNGTVVDYTFSDTGNTNGVGGSDALSLEWDASALVTDTGYTLKFFSNQIATGTAATSDNSSDYTLEFDLSTLGLVSASTSINFDINFGGVTATTFPTITDASGFTHYSIDLGTLSAFDSLTAANINSSLQIKFYTWDDQGYDKFGADAGNAIYVDNITLTQAAAIPEPSTFAALAGALALGVTMIRRRRS
jgi:hypothetical protein